MEKPFFPYTLTMHQIISNIDKRSPIFIICALSVLGWLAVMISPDLAQFGMSSYLVSLDHRILQFLLYSFLHGWLLHILSNVLFFLFIGRIVEIRHWYKYVWFLWAWTTFFVGMALMYFSEYYTIGGSGFAMSLLSVYAFDLYRNKNGDFKWALLLIAINIFVGFSSDVSLLGHLSWAIAGWLFALVFKR